MLIVRAFPRKLLLKFLRCNPECTIFFCCAKNREKSQMNVILFTLPFFRLLLLRNSFGLLSSFSFNLKGHFATHVSNCPILFQELQALAVCCSISVPARSLFCLRPFWRRSRKQLLCPLICTWNTIHEKDLVQNAHWEHFPSSCWLFSRFITVF